MVPRGKPQCDHVFDTVAGTAHVVFCKARRGIKVNLASQSFVDLLHFLGPGISHHMQSPRNFRELVELGCRVFPVFSQSPVNIRQKHGKNQRKKYPWSLDVSPLP